MDDVKMSVEALIKKIEANMETHQATYETAVEEYNTQQLEVLEDLVAKKRAGKPIDPMALSRMPVPENHMADYKRALELLRQETRKEIKLDPRDFNRYFLDEWEWRQHFAANTEVYAASSLAR